MKLKLLLCLALVLSITCDAAIIYPKAPEGGREIVFDNVGQMLRKHPDGPALRVRGLKMEDLTIAEPHREYNVEAADLASGHLLSAATSRSWRYILLHGTDAVGVVSVGESDAKMRQALAFNSLLETGFSVETLEALRQAKELPQIKK